MKTGLMVMLMSCFGSVGVLHAQWQVGFFSPFLSQTGVSIAYGKALSTWMSRADRSSAHVHQLAFLPQLHFAMQPGLNHGLMIEPSLQYRWNKAERAFFLTSELGLGYLFILQLTSVEIDLATGDARPEHETLHQLVPNLGLGMGFLPKKHLGLFIRGNVGRSLGLGSSNAIYLALSTGVIVTFKTIAQ